MKLLDASDPFFVPRWRRWATIALPSLWAAWEFHAGNTGWALLFVGLSTYALWILIVQPKYFGKE